MSTGWKTTILKSEAQALDVLAGLRRRRWLSRGQARRYRALVPSIDREGRERLSRHEKLAVERQSIELFRSTARFFADQGEQQALADDILTLAVLRHYGVPTRLLDWSRSPYVAAYFAACDHETEDGEIWSFDEPLYEQEGAKQWKRWPETTRDGSGDGHKLDLQLTAFALDEPPDWFVCIFYPDGFHRQNAQTGAYSVTARFGRDHAAAALRANNR